MGPAALNTVVELYRGAQLTFIIKNNGVCERERDLERAKKSERGIVYAFN